MAVNHSRRPGRRVLRRGIGVALALSLMTAVPVARSWAQEPTGAVTTEAVFNDPLGDASEQAAIVDRVVELIDGAAAGSRVRMSMFYAKDATIPNALIAAADRGVNVEVMFDYSQRVDFPEVFGALSEALGEDTSQPSFVSSCPKDRGCIGTRKLSDVTALNHNKFLLFSDTMDTPNVVVQTSANLNPGRDGTKGWNNALVLTGHDAIYASYSAYFDDQIAAKPDNNYYDTRTAVTEDDAKIHYYPRAESSGGDPYRDPSEDSIATILDNIDCFGNTEVGTPDDFRTVIRANQSIFSRPYLADKLVALDKAGCYVEVVLNYNPDSKLEVESLTKLLAKTDSGYNGVNVGYYCKSDTTWTHSKYLMVEGNYYGVGDRRIAWTGSHNWSANSLRQADETLLQLEDSTVVGAYRENFKTAYAATEHQPGNGGPISC